jgi:apolipoprotein N-acyltransferase
MRSMQFAGLAALAIVSGLLATLSLPAFDLGWLAWIGIAPMLFALRQRGLLAGAVLGFLFGCALGAASFFWINVIDDITPMRFALAVAVFGLYYLAFGFLYALANRSIGSWIIVCGPLLWVALEYARGSLWFLAYPWNFLAHSQYQYLPLIQIADLTGAYGVSFVLIMTNQLVSQLPDLRSTVARWRWGPQAIALGVVLAATLLYGWHKLGETPGSDHLRVAMVQANVIARNGMSRKEQMAHLGAYHRLTRQAAKQKPALIVWPSSSLPAPLAFWTIRMYVSEMAHQAGTHLLVGGAGGDKLAPAREGQLPYSNSEFLISPAGRLEGQYNKIRLTPFTEQVPLQGTVRWPRWLTTLEKSFVPGDGYTLFKVSQARFGAPICWENSFPDLFRRFVLAGANVMVSVTNEYVFGSTSGPYQTLAMNAFRAVENRVAIARAATTGISAFIDSRGRIVSRVADADGKDLFVAGVLVWDVPLATEKSFYTRHGDLFAQAAAAVALLMVVLGAWRRRA